jgi:hypothetical protein
VSVGAGAGVSTPAPCGVQLGHRSDLAAGDRPRRTSEVEVRFIAESAERTRVELVHRNLERHGPDWRSVGDGIDGEAGWPLYLHRYAEVIGGTGQ